MSKFVIKVTREIEDPFVGVMNFETSLEKLQPSKDEITKWLSKEHYIDDDPEYTRYEIVEHIV